MNNKPDYKEKDNIGWILREAALYFDFYGPLLTARQSEILDFYYNENYSLSEISKFLGISRQAAHETLKIASLALIEYEKKLGLVSNYFKRQKYADDVRELVDEINVEIERLKVHIGAGAAAGITDGLKSAGARINDAIAHLLRNE